MLERKFVIHPELGLAEVVEEHKRVELSQLKDDVDVKRAELEGVQTRISRAQAELDDLREEEAAKEASLEESKSYFARGEELVGGSADGLDSGTVDSGESLEDESEEPSFATSDVTSTGDFNAVNY